MSHHETVTADHVEYASKDPAATRKFLEKTLGYNFQVLEQMGGYGLRTDKVARGAGTGVRLVEKGENSGTIAYLTVGNLDEALTTVQAAGAKLVMPKTEVPGLGWHAVVHAPGDVLMGFFQAAPR
jgi:predicted enzyme related to lactoylglutathione lyase